jgi:hypothetical protein
MDEQACNAKRHDPFDDERWSFPRAAAWIIWRSREYVAQLLDLTENEGHVQVFDIFNEAVRRENGRGGPPEGSVLPFVEAQAELWEQLKRGRLTATGVRVEEATWSRIAPEVWSELDYSYCGRGKSNAVGVLGIVKYFDVTLPRAEVLTLWPMVQPENNQSRRGRKPKIDVDHIRSTIWELLNDNGDISLLDPDWRTQTDIRAALREKLIKQFGGDNIPGTSSLKGYVSRIYPEWKSWKVKN